MKRISNNPIRLKSDTVQWFCIWIVEMQFTDVYLPELKTIYKWNYYILPSQIGFSSFLLPPPSNRVASSCSLFFFFFVLKCFHVFVVGHLSHLSQQYVPARLVVFVLVSRVCIWMLIEGAIGMFDVLCILCVCVIVAVVAVA